MIDSTPNQPRNTPHAGHMDYSTHLKREKDVFVKSEWQQEIEAGACTADEFFDELYRRINARYDELEKLSNA